MTSTLSNFILFIFTIYGFDFGHFAASASWPTILVVKHIAASASWPTILVVKHIAASASWLGQWPTSALSPNSSE
jgi:hypothetical protein